LAADEFALEISKDFLGFEYVIDNPGKFFGNDSIRDSFVGAVKDHLVEGPYSWALPRCMDSRISKGYFQVPISVFAP